MKPDKDNLFLAAWWTVALMIIFGCTFIFYKGRIMVQKEADYVERCRQAGVK